MAEYIDRDEISEVLNKFILNDPNCPKFIAATVQQIVDLCPAADVQKIKRGKWLVYNYEQAICSHCGKILKTPFNDDDEAEYGWTELPDYCEDCGAYMY